jgi:hypothetical protein
MRSVRLLGVRVAGLGRRTGAEAERSVLAGLEAARASALTPAEREGGKAAAELLAIKRLVLSPCDRLEPRCAIVLRSSGVPAHGVLPPERHNSCSSRSRVLAGSSAGRIVVALYGRS